MSQNLFRRGYVYNFKKVIHILNETEVTNIIDYFKRILYIYIHLIQFILNLQIQYNWR